MPDSRTTPATGAHTPGASGPQHDPTVVVRDRAVRLHAGLAAAASLMDLSGTGVLAHRRAVRELPRPLRRQWDRVYVRTQRCVFAGLMALMTVTVTEPLLVHGRTGRTLLLVLAAVGSAVPLALVAAGVWATRHPLAPEATGR